MCRWALVRDASGPRLFSPAAGVATMAFLAMVAVNESLTDGAGRTARTLASAGIAIGIALLIDVAVIGPHRRRMTSDRAVIDYLLDQVDELAALRAFTAGTDVAAAASCGLLTSSELRRRGATMLRDAVPFSLALCDIDAFERYRDAHGSDGGQRALRLYAEVISASLRPDDLVAREGGDKFMCIFPKCSAEQARAVMERVRESLVLTLATQELAPFTASVGISHSSQADRVETLIEIGDVALVVAKHLGGNRVGLDDFALDAVDETTPGH